MAANLEYDEVPETSTELEDDKEDPLPTLTVCATGVNIDSDGTVTATENGKLGMLYVAFLQALLKPSTAQGKASTRRACNWVHRRTPGLRWRLLLSEAQGQSINWKKMGSIAGDWRARGEAPPLLNFSRGFKLLCRKAMLCTTLRQYALARPVADVHSWFPPSFVFYPAKPEQSEKEAFLEAFERRRASETVSATATGNSNVWILKPSDGGKGERIKVLSGNNGPTEILHFLETQPAGSISWVVSEYLERPLLLPGRRKFDWRLWVHLDTVTYAIRLYREGVLRTCSVPFSLADLSDEFAHLSNHCIQVNSKSYGGHEPTNEMFYAEFERVLQEQLVQEVEAGGGGSGGGGSGVGEREGGERRRNGVCSGSSGGSLMETVLLPQARRVIVETLLSARDTLQCDPDLTGAACFNVFGLGLMVDQDFGVQLIEVNSSPAVADGLLNGLVTGLVGVVQLQLDGNQHSAPSLVSFSESDVSGDDGGSGGGCEATSGSKDDDGDGGWELLFAGGSSPPPSVPFPHPLQARRPRPVIPAEGTLLSARNTLQCDPELTGAACFNVFGFDLMVDQDFGVQLIEVNSSPAVADGLLDGLVTGLVGVVQLQLDGNQQSAPSLVSFNESDASGDDGGSEGGCGGGCEATSGSKDDDGDGGWELLFAGGSSPPPSELFPHPHQARR